MKKIAILLSTYNGEAFVDTQIASLLAQENVEVTIFARDDGSRDATPSILQQYAVTHHNVHVTLGKNQGVIASFYSLLEVVNQDFDYYAFADQDDYWHPKKMISAVEMLQQYQPNQPLLYCSALEYVDSSLQHLGWSNLNFKPSFGNAIVENIITGCTAVFNLSLKQLAVEYRPKQAVMHDWWLYLLATAFGQVAYDAKSYIQYRQHNANVVGAAPNFISLWKRRLIVLCQRKPILSAVQAEEFYRHYGQQLSKEKHEILQHFVNRKHIKKSRLWLLSSPIIYKQTRLDTIAIKFLFAMGWY